MHATWPLILIVPALAAVAVPWGPWEEPTARPAAVAVDAVMPRYGADRALQLPDDYREWVFIGSSIGLSYAPSASQFYPLLAQAANVKVPIQRVADAPAAHGAKP